MRRSDEISSHLSEFMDMMAGWFEKNVRTAISQHHRSMSYDQIHPKKISKCRYNQIYYALLCRQHWWVQSCTLVQVKMLKRVLDSRAEAMPLQQYTVSNLKGDNFPSPQNYPRWKFDVRHSVLIRAVKFSYTLTCWQKFYTVIFNNKPQV